MRNRLLVLPAAVAGPVMVTTAAVNPPREPARPGAPTAMAPAPARAVLLLNGDWVLAGPGAGRRTVAVLPPGSGLGGSLLTLGAGGMRYEIPVAAVPRGWACRWVSTPPHLRGRDCVAEPMMTLGYRVAGLGLDGSAAAGRQSVGITVGHLQLAAAARITAATVRVSFDGGKTWHAAAVTGSGGTYRAAFTAPAGAYVTLRVTAADAAGGRIAETVTRAYKIAP